ncbi:MAG: TIGR00266 family protein [Sporomusaceae bacterium]|nr:TIGR00266 family protein [Sporomusaceae bacterium]
MDYEILYPGAFPLLKVQLGKGETLKAESDAMVSMASTIDVEGKIEGGLLGGIGRMLSGEKFFFQTLSARRGPGEVLLAPAIPGDIVDVELDGSYSLVVQKDGFLAGSMGIEVSSKMQNLMQGLFSGEGFFTLKVSGKGTVFLNSYGGIHAINLEAGEERIVDNSHLVAWPDYMDYKIEKASSGWISSFTSGEMLVCRFKGPGVVLIQTRNPQGFAGWIKQLLPPSK